MPRLPHPAMFRANTTQLPRHRRAVVVAIPFIATISLVITTTGISGASAARSASLAKRPNLSSSISSSRQMSGIRGAIAVGKTSAFCRDAANAAKSNASSAASDTPASLANLYKQLKSEESLVLADSPSQIHGDFQTLFNYFNKFYGELASVGYNILKLPASFISSLSSQTAPLTAASKAITTYLKKACGITG